MRLLRRWLTTLFKLQKGEEKMPFQIVHQNITSFACDAVVNPTDWMYSHSGGTDQQIHEAAGPALEKECRKLPPLATGGVAVTSGYDLPCRHVIHTVGPIWEGGENDEPILLRSCYINALLAAKKQGDLSVAFPLISSGTFGFPKDQVLRIAIDAISDFLEITDGEMNISICILDRNSYTLSKEIALNEYLESARQHFVYEDHAIRMESCEEQYCPPETDDHPFPKAAVPAEEDLAAWIAGQDDTFAVMLLKLIDKKGITEAQCYHRANVSKQTFWKIMNNDNYRPSKATVISFAVALELTWEETESLLRTVGFSMSHSNKFDLIIEFYIRNGCYDLFEIDAALYKYDQMTIGSDL